MSDDLMGEVDRLERYGHICANADCRCDPCNSVRELARIAREQVALARTDHDEVCSVLSVAYSEECRNHDATRQRAEKAEAENARLTETLRLIDEYSEFASTQSLGEMARAALRAKEDR